MMKGLGCILGVVLLVFFVFVISMINIMNRIKTLKIAVLQAKADIEIYMVKRYDVIMNSVKVLKKNMDYESKTLEKLLRIRKGMDVGELQQQAVLQDKAWADIFAVAEAYPELKSQTSFQELQRQISDENEHFAASKRMYNANVTTYNQYLVVFPNSIVASMLGSKPAEFFKDNDAENKKNADVDF